MHVKVMHVIVAGFPATDWLKIGCVLMNAFGAVSELVVFL